MGLFGKSRIEKELEHKVDKLINENQGLKDNLEQQNNLIKTKEKVIDMIMMVNDRFNDDTNIENLTKIKFGEEEYIRNWFQSEDGKNKILGRFEMMIRAHYSMFQDFGSNKLTDKISLMLDNEFVSARINELAEINDAHSIQSSFDEWKEQFIMTLQENNIEYSDYEEQTITSYLVYETMYRAMILRMETI
ncbi:MAG: hypothetical protein HRT40_07910 [Campylobacteraceae bacterium]|nr:hypothetical protein [Campylobacteraceae bacterium]